MSKKKQKTGKLELLRESLDTWDRYRGNLNLTWRLADTGMRSQRPIEEFALRCKCGRWYGWTHLSKAEEVLKRIHEIGCPVCRNR